MSTQPVLEQQLATDWPSQAWNSTHVVVAVSGGADSVALLRAMCSLREQSPGEGPGELVVAHIDHGLREESPADALFVEQLAERLDCRAIICRVDTARLAQHAGDGLEAAARQLRYTSLLETAHQVGARYLATAHTADDQAETVVHRIVRGTGLAGLAGVPRTRRLSDSVTLIRPLLGVRRREVEAYLTEIGQDFRTDATNRQTDFTRNRIRHELLPQLARDFNPAVVEAILRLGQNAAEATETLDQVAEKLSQAAVLVSQADRIVIDCHELADATKHLRTLVLASQWSLQGWPQQSMTREHWLRLATMTLPEPATAAKIDFPGGVQAEKKEAGQLVLTRFK